MTKQKPALRLEQYFLSEVSVKANPDYEFGASDGCRPPSISADVKYDEGDKLLFAVDFHAANSDGGKSVPYEFNISMFATFRADIDINDKKLFAVTIRNSMSILYGAARDFLLTVTARGPWAGYMLPTVEPKDLLKSVSITKVENKTEGNTASHKTAHASS